MQHLPIYREVFRLVESDAECEILRAKDIAGFFAEAPAPGGVVQLSGVRSMNPLRPTLLQDIALQVLDLSESPAATYYIGEVEVVEITPSDFGDGVDVVGSFKGYYLPFPYAADIWRRWVDGTPIVVGEWQSLDAHRHSSWLHVVQAAWFGGGRDATRCTANASYSLDGSSMANVSSFYIALGEAVNGAGGYFGSGLSALEDCLRNATLMNSFELIWRDFSTSETALGQQEVAAITELLREYGVTLLIEN
ncbi:barstar family protein [Micromonospora aurantiaca (nom. illeg.)]|uniref:barstar family protein n=1 Tax=Micromonospora aurantiaca (nom. illeg.) TaxID=47850 RepID=UPI003F4A1161